MTSLLLALVFAAVPGLPPTTNESPVKVDRNDPNFVTASLLVMSPGKEIFACAGHACFRMECPAFKLDNCYSYESESAFSRLLSFFSGNLKMGMFSLKTADYLSFYEKDGRGVRQYRLNISPAAKIRLWKLLDDKVALGANLPYDYERRGCAQSVFRVLQDALLPDLLRIEKWPDKYKKKRREIIASAIDNSPWSRIAIHTIVGTGGDRYVTQFEKVVIPKDLLELLKVARIGDQPIIAENDGIMLLTEKNAQFNPFFTPVALSLVFLILAIIQIFIHVKAIDFVFLAIQSIIGVFLTYLVVFSHLPATNWNWLLIPFNPLPLIFWKWRRFWMPPFGIIIIGWCICMQFSPDMLTDPAYIVFALALAVTYFSPTITRYLTANYRRDDAPNGMTRP